MDERIITNYELKEDTFEQSIRPDSIDEYIQRRNGKIKIDYFHKDLEIILKDTYGIVIYQEQIMQIACIIAGYSLGEADILRRAMSKKKEDMILY